jgi:hypothetical protein
MHSVLLAWDPTINTMLLLPTELPLWPQPVDGRPLDLEIQGGSPFRVSVKPSISIPGRRETLDVNPLGSKADSGSLQFRSG